LTGEVPAGRFAPSPTGDLHVGNLRTALIAWLCARSTNSRFVLRFEDLDRVTSRPEFRENQARDLAAIGIDWDGEPLVQSTRFDAHHDAISMLVHKGHTFECFCTRREIAEAAQAPNGLDASARTYPGTCRSLTRHQRAEHLAAGRRPALRLRGDQAARTVHDRLLGTSTHFVDDVVLRRNDGVPAYNLAVVVDDAYQGVEEVVRADDLLPSTVDQMRIAELLGLPSVSYVHVPLVTNGSGERLAKRDGAVALSELAEQGHWPAAVRIMLLQSIGHRPDDEPSDSFVLSSIPKTSWAFPAS
jgi:glutamyl-tRNA synthetase